MHTILEFVNQANPPRKCGTKKSNAFYGEGGGFSPTGSLNVWTWLLGDGMEQTIAFEVPARQIIPIDPVLTVFFQSYMFPTNARIVIPPEAEELYDKLLASMKSPGVADHVGANFYTPWDFAIETRIYGASRRIPKKTAKQLAELISLLGPLPIAFTHSKIPVFPTTAHRQAAVELAIEYAKLDDYFLKGDHLYWGPSWTQKDWGMYAREYQMPGDDHFMLPVLRLLDGFENNEEFTEKDHPTLYNKVKDTISDLDFVEQTFGLSWLTQISYTLPDEGEPEEDIFEIPGLNIIDLKAIEKEVEYERA